MPRLSLHQVFPSRINPPADQLSEIDATVAIIRARTQAEALGVLDQRQVSRTASDGKICRQLRLCSGHNRFFSTPPIRAR